MSVLIFLTLTVLFFVYWTKERREERKLREMEQLEQLRMEGQRISLEHERFETERIRYEDQKRQTEVEHERNAKIEDQRLEEERMHRWETAQREERQAIANSAGTQSGGYIVVEMSEKERPLFHDLLKGFEDYAKLKGYDLAFSIDSSFADRIAFKFTLKNDGVVVGAERVRHDFREYLERVRDVDHAEELDNLPVIVSIEEHSLLVTLLKNRISFLHHSYQLSQNAVRYYEGLLNNVRAFPALPAPSVIVQTGGTMDSRKYDAVNSSRLIQGEGNTYSDSSLNVDIGGSFSERQARVMQLDDLIKRLEALESKEEAAIEAGVELHKVKSEMTEYREPNTSAIRKWMERAKQLLATAALGAEVTDAAHKLFNLFGLS